MIVELFRQNQRTIEELYIVQQCFRSLVLEKGYASESDLDAMAEQAKRNPQLQKLARENFAVSRQTLMEIGVDDLEDPTPGPRSTDKSN